MDGWMEKPTKSSEVTVQPYTETETAINVSLAKGTESAVLTNFVVMATLSYDMNTCFKKKEKSDPRLLYV